MADFLFVAQQDAAHFAEPYLRYLDHDRLNPGYKHQSPKNIHAAILKHAFEGARTLWLEWANEYTAKVIEYAKPPIFTVVRIHDYEVRTGRVRDMAWHNVDAIWFINRMTRRAFLQLCPDVDERKTFVLPNAVDLGEWPYVARGERHIGMYSVNMQERKRYERAVDVIAELPSDWRLTIRTEATPTEQFIAFNAYADSRGVSNRITLELRPFVAGSIIKTRREMVDFWRDKSHVLSVSAHEAFHYMLAEGMACGCAGAALRWEWGEPEQFYSNVFQTPRELADFCLSTHPSEAWRIAIEPYAAPALAYKLIQVVEECRTNR